MSATLVAINQKTESAQKWVEEGLKIRDRLRDLDSHQIPHDEFLSIFEKLAQRNTILSEPAYSHIPLPEITPTEWGYFRAKTVVYCLMLELCQDRDQVAPESGKIKSERSWHMKAYVDRLEPIAPSPKAEDRFRLSPDRPSDARGQTSEELVFI
jgi:hypothetical protein